MQSATLDRLERFEKGGKRHGAAAIYLAYSSP